ncbi:MAG: hypothetical protein AAB361_00380 [Patescibacteria group bacterium]
MNKKVLRVLKSAGVVVLAVLIFYLAMEAGFRTKDWLDLKKANKEATKLNESILKMFQEDTFGGKTPEETFDLFVTALKNEDVDLAVKYIVLDIERRQKYYDEFNEKKQKEKLIEYIDNWPKWEDWSQTRDDYTDWEKRAEVWYSADLEKPTIIYDPYIKENIEVPPGNYLQQEIIFTKNINNIWKIESL